MAEQAGATAAALQARRTALLRQYDKAADADRVLAEALAAAHAATVHSVRRLDEIAAEIDRAVAAQAGVALDTAAGVRELQRFLIAKQRDIFAVVSDAYQLDGAKKGMLEGLRSHYAASAGTG